METVHLQEYVVLALRRSFTEAARELHLTQSTLSKHIAALEREFNTELFIRERDGVHLTEAGAVLYQQITQINHLLSQTYSLVKEARSDKATKTEFDDPKVRDIRKNIEIRHKCTQLAKTYKLSPQETAALILYLEERGFVAIQAELELSRDAVAELLGSVYRKLNIKSKQEALDVTYSVSECS